MSKRVSERDSKHLSTVCRNSLLVPVQTLTCHHDGIQVIHNYMKFLLMLLLLLLILDNSDSGVEKM
jgi:hypothetical protein